MDIYKIMIYIVLYLIIGIIYTFIRLLLVRLIHPLKYDDWTLLYIGLTIIIYPLDFITVIFMFLSISIKMLVDKIGR